MSLNSLAHLGASLGLLLDLHDLDGERLPSLPRLARPAPDWQLAGAPDAQRLAALRWIVNCAPRPWPREKRNRLELLPAEATSPDRNGAASDQRWVRASGTALTVWRPPDRHDYFGTDGLPLNGLYGFMEDFAWPLWVNGYVSRRLTLESELPTMTAAALERNLRHRQAKREAIRRSIDNLLEQHSRARSLYAAVDSEDVPRLRRYQWAWMRFQLGIEPQNLAEYLTLIAEGDAPKVAARKQHLQYRILYQLLRDRIERGEFTWHHPDYDRLQADDAAEDARISHAAQHYYAEDFRKFCLGDEVLELERTLFAGTRFDRSRPYPELIQELAATHKPLPLARQWNLG